MKFLIYLILLLLLFSFPTSAQKAIQDIPDTNEFEKVKPAEDKSAPRS